MRGRPRRVLPCVGSYSHRVHDLSVVGVLVSVIGGSIRSLLDTESRTTLFRTLSNLFMPVMIRRFTGQVSDPHDMMRLTRIEMENDLKRLRVYTCYKLTNYKFSVNIVVIFKK